MSSSKVKRKVTVESSKDRDEPRRPSVFERLGPNAVNVTSQSSDRHSRSDENEICRQFYRTGACSYGDTCRYKHGSGSQSSKKSSKQEKESEEKESRRKSKIKKDETKTSRTSSLSPKRIGKRSNSRSRKGEHDSKIKSTVVVTRPKSPMSAVVESSEPKKKSEGNWEDDSDDWPMDAAQLDFKEELTLERKRQQLQRELALEIQKERLMNENVTITKTVSFSESSSSSSSSDSGSVSSSSGSSSSSSEDDSDDSSSSSSSSSSSGSRPPAKLRSKKPAKEAGHEKTLIPKSKIDYEKVKAGKSKPSRARSPSVEAKVSKKSREKRKDSPRSPRRKGSESRNASVGKSNLNAPRGRGPRTPSPVGSRKQRQWAHSSSTDSRSAEVSRNKGKKNKKSSRRNRLRKSKRGPVSVRPGERPPLSSPNRIVPKKKRDENRSRRRGRNSSPPLLPTTPPSQTTAKQLGSSQRHPTEEKTEKKHRSRDRSKGHSRKESESLLSGHKRVESRDRSSKRSRSSTRRDAPRISVSPVRDRFDLEVVPISKKSVVKEEKMEHRVVTSISPARTDRRKLVSSDVDKKRDISPRVVESRREVQLRGSDGLHDKRVEKVKRALSPEIKKVRDERSRDYDAAGWTSDHRKSNSSTGRRTPEPRSRQEARSSGSLPQADRPRDADRKKRKERDHSTRSEEPERVRLPSPRRSPSPMLPHHSVREIEPLPGARSRIYEQDVPPPDREYPYGYEPIHDPYDRLLPPEYEADVLHGPGLYPDLYPESRYRRDVKDAIDRYGHREVLSPREVLPPRDVISLAPRSDEYLPDLPLEDRPYDERWQRGRPRDEWDAYGALPAAPLPPHVTAALDEDRYGMPRRRRASPEWPRARLDDREPVVAGHGRPSRAPLPREGRSRSPPKAPGSRGSWSERSGRRDRSDSKHEEPSKGSSEDRKGKSSRKDRPKSKDDAVETKKEKSGKRPHSPSPVKENKKRKEDKSTPDKTVSEKSSHKRSKDEAKSESKSAVARTQKSSKQDNSPRSDSPKTVAPVDKAEHSKPPESKSKEDRRSRNDSSKKDDEFSDWSDGDDDLLNRDDMSEETKDAKKSKHKSSEVKVKEKEVKESKESTSSKRKEKPAKDPQIKKVKDTNSRTSSRDRNMAILDKCFANFTQKRNSGSSKSGKSSSSKKSETTSSSSASKPPEESSSSKEKHQSDSKDSDVPESSSFKDDAATDVDEYITAESVDYDPISDDELDALIEEPEETAVKPEETEKSKIVDALEVDWSALMSETKPEFKPGCARKRFSAANVLSRIGFSQVFAGPQLSEKLIDFCQKQLDEEKKETENDKKNEDDKNEPKKFVMEHQIAAFHVSVSEMKRERVNIFNKAGPFRRALCARRDLQIRNFLCKPSNKFSLNAAVSYSPQYGIFDKDLYKQSLELLKGSPVEPVQPIQPMEVNAC